MWRRSFLTLALVLAWSPGGDEAAAAAPEAAKPNVLMIAIDDQNDWIGCLGGHELASTPNIDALAARGTLFANAHCQSPLCNSSRTSLLASRRPSSTGIYGLAPPLWNTSLWDETITLPYAFRRGGYFTATTGKIYHGKPGDPQKAAREFDRWGPPSQIGVRPEEPLVDVMSSQPNRLMDWGVFPHEDSQKGDAIITDWAVDQLSELSAEGPFLLSVGYFLPHVPIYVTQKWYDDIPDDDRLMPEQLLVDDRADTPAFSWRLHWHLPEPRRAWLQRHNEHRNIVRSYLAATRFVDYQIGRILSRLDELGLSENTIVVLWSDHGYHLGEKEISGKNTLWERSTHVPLIFAGPAIGQGVCTQPVELLDVYPTLAALCDLPADPAMEGVSLTAQLQDPATRRLRPAITTHNQGNHAVRSQTYRYIQYADGTEEFYDVASDPHELHNLAASPSMQTPMAEHRRWLPRIDLPPREGSQHRILTYDPATDTAVWEGTTVQADDPDPMAK